MGWLRKYAKGIVRAQVWWPRELAEGIVRACMDYLWKWALDVVWAQLW